MIGWISRSAFGWRHSETAHGHAYETGTLGGLIGDWHVAFEYESLSSGSTLWIRTGTADISAFV